jgi:hypothetical protein
MLSREQKKEAISKFKERKAQLGIYAVRCLVTGQVWVGHSKNLEATRNGTWFSLRLGSHYERTLQAEWNAQGECSFEYEVLEQFEDDVLPLALSDLFKNRKQDWIARLNAHALR